MDFQTVLNYLAPLVVIGLTQILKTWIKGKYAPIIVLVLGGLSALLKIGPAPGDSFIDSTVNAGWVGGIATLIYDLVHKIGKKGETAAKAIIPVFLVFSLLACGAQQANPPDSTGDEAFIRTSYRTLALSQVTYDFLLKNFSYLNETGNVSPEKYAEGMRLANKWHDAQEKALKEMIAYLEGGSSRSLADLAVKGLEAAFAEAERYLKKQGAGEERKPLIR